MNMISYDSDASAIELINYNSECLVFNIKTF